MPSEPATHIGSGPQRQRGLAALDASRMPQTQRMAIIEAASITIWLVD
jgi:hypothetical protein